MSTEQNNKALRIHAGWLIDGTGGPIQKNICLWIHDGHILDISTAEKRDPNPGLSLEYKHCTIIPPLVDSHVHLFMSETYDQKIRKNQLNSTYSTAKNLIREHINNYLAFGVLSVRDGGDGKAHTLRYKREVSHLKDNPFWLKVAGKALHRQGRYGRLIGRAVKEKESLAEMILFEDIDHVKIVNSGLNSLTQFGKETAPQFSINELKQIVRKARSMGLRTMVHANGKIAVNNAVLAGCDSVEHGFFMGKENLKLMADNNIIWVPTAYTMTAYAQYFKSTGMKTDVVRKNSDHQLEQLRYAAEIDLPIALGTDAGSIGVSHGEAVVEEMKIMKEAGHSISKLIKYATSTGTGLLGINEFGRVTKGMPASFLVIKGSPASLPGSIREIEVIYYKGKPMKL